MRDQYKDNTKVGGWSCINSVFGLITPTVVYNSENFGKKLYPKLGYRKLNLADTLKPGDIVQIPGNSHTVLYLSPDTYYNTHGFVTPFKNGNQIKEDDFYPIGGAYRKQ